MALSGDGSKLATGSDDRTVKARRPHAQHSAAADVACTLPLPLLLLLLLRDARCAPADVPNRPCPAALRRCAAAAFVRTPSRPPARPPARLAGIAACMRGCLPGFS